MKVELNLEKPKKVEREAGGEMSEEFKEGWGHPFDSRMLHYFRNGYSLCGRWYYNSSLVKINCDDSGLPKCATCSRRLKHFEYLFG